MAQKGTLAVKGYKDVIKGLTVADRETRLGTRAIFRQVGDRVKTAATTLFTPEDARSAAGYRTRVRQRGIAVEQSLRKTSGLHPEFGALQMRKALVPAVEENEDNLNRDLEAALDQVAAKFNRG